MSRQGHIPALACALLAFCAAPAATQNACARPPADAEKQGKRFTYLDEIKIERRITRGRGYSEQDLGKSLDGNGLRLVPQVEQVARRMQSKQ